MFMISFYFLYSNFRLRQANDVNYYRVVKVDPQASRRVNSIFFFIRFFPLHYLIILGVTKMVNIVRNCEFKYYA